MVKASKIGKYNDNRHEASHLTADGVMSSPSILATIDHVSMVGFRFASQIARRSIWRSRSTVQLNGILFERRLDGSSEAVGSQWNKEVFNEISSLEMLQQ